MKFTLEVEVAGDAERADKELGRILRYWAGNLKHYPFKQGAGEKVYDSEYVEVGSWRFS